MLKRPEYGIYDTYHRFYLLHKNCYFIVLFNNIKKSFQDSDFCI